LFEGTLQEIVNIIFGMADHLPEAKISIGIGIVLVIIIVFAIRLGIFLIFAFITILAAASFFAQGDIYQLTAERALAGIILGFFALIINFYLLGRTIADWKD
jgi:hypothetical protein